MKKCLLCFNKPLTSSAVHFVLFLPYISDSGKNWGEKLP